MVRENSTADLRRKRGPDGGLRGVFKDHLKGWQLTPIETGVIVSGVPDAEFCAPGGISGWIEFKYVRQGNAVGLRPAQVAWIDRRYRLGGRVFIAVQRRDELYIYDGSGVRELKIHGLESTKGLLHQSVGRWDWDAISEALLKSS
jgi:hypothetical protein